MISDAIGMTILGGGIAIAAAIIKFVPQRQNQNGKWVREELCQERHKTLDGILHEIKNSQIEMQRDITQIKLAIVPVTTGKRETER